MPSQIHNRRIIDESDDSKTQTQVKKAETNRVSEGFNADGFIDNLVAKHKKNESSSSSFESSSENEEDGKPLSLAQK